MDEESAQLLQLLVSAAEIDVGPVEQLHSLFSSGQARDVELDNVHVLALHSLSKSLPTAVQKHVSTAILDVLLTGFSWPETLVNLTATVGDEQATQAFTAILEAVRHYSESLHRKSMSTTRDNMGLVTMVTTSRGGAGAGAGSHAATNGNASLPHGRTAGACPAVKQRQAKWDDSSALRAILLWTLANWPSCRESFSQCIVQGLVEYGQTLEPGHAHAIRIHLQVLQSILLAEPPGRLLSSEQHARSLLRDLARLREMEGMISDTASALGVYHEALVGVVWVIVGRYPALMMNAVQGALSAWTRAMMGTTAAAMLLLHEAQTLYCWALSSALLESSPPGQSQQALSSSSYLEQVLVQLLPTLAQCVSSENSRLAQLGLGFFKDKRFISYLHHVLSADGVTGRVAVQNVDKIRSGLSTVVFALLRQGNPHWNHTVNRQVHATLAVMADLCPQILQQQIEHVFAAGTAEGISEHEHEQEQLGALLSVHHPSHGGLPRPGRMHASVPSPAVPASSLGANIPMHGFKPGSQPPATVTGVAPWATAGKGTQPPVTITGVAPWAKSSGPGQGLGAELLLRPQPVLGKKAAPPAGLTPQQRYDAFLQLLVPPPAAAEDASNGSLRMPSKDGSGGWDSALPHWLSTRPVYLPTLAFHDLVFGPELGSGAFATVRYAKAVVRGRGDSSWPEYAVKIISRRTLEEMGYDSNARREVAVLSHLTHPNTARMVSSFSWREGIYLVLEYGSRGDLHTLLTKLGSLDEDSARWLCGEVLAALIAVHNLGLLYCDCKPENIVLVEDASGGLHAKLTDFAACRPMPAGSVGHAKGRALVDAARGALTQLRDGGWRPEGSAHTPYASTERTVPIGNPTPVDASVATAAESVPAASSKEEDERIECTEEYLPPEAKVRAGAYIDRPTVGWDAYAFGVLIYQCLTGRLPDEDAIWGGEDKPGSSASQDTSGTSAGADKKGVQFHGLPGTTAADGFPQDFPETAKSLVRALLHPNVTQRLGCSEAAGSASGLRAIAGHDWFTPIGGVEGVQTLYSRKAPLVSQGSAALPSDPRWSRRHNSSIWAPLPSSYSLPGGSSTVQSEQDPNGRTNDSRPGASRRRAADFTLYELAVLDTVPPL